MDIIAPVVEENKVVTTLDNVRSLAGCMVSCELAVGGARIHLRNIYRLVVKYELVSRHRARHVYVSWSEEAIEELKWWWENIVGA